MKQLRPDSMKCSPLPVWPLQARALGRPGGCSVLVVRPHDGGRKAGQRTNFIWHFLD